MAPILDATRALLGADVALALARAPESDEVCIVAASADEHVRLPRRDEALVWLCDARQTTPSQRPATVTDAALHSRRRAYRLDLATAITVPWSGLHGTGWLIIGDAAEGERAIAADLRVATSRRLQGAHGATHERGAVATERDLLAAIKRVGRAELDAEDVADIFDAIVFAARELFGTAVAYVALPEADYQHFNFTNLLGVRTSEFRRLRMRVDQGLGGLARIERRAIRTIDYGTDRRLRGAPFSETRGEGIVSAMSTPLMVDGTIAATLYVGNRRATAFTDKDLALLDEFAETTTIGLSRRQAHEHRIAVARKREQERLAFAVHDTVVRSLVQIGFQAQDGALIAADTDLRSRLEQIGEAAESCLQTLRGDLKCWDSSPAADRFTSVGEIVETLRATHRREDVTRTFELANASAATELPTGVARAIERIGQEALINAELHSHCAHQRVVIDCNRRSVAITIADDGDGIDPAKLLGAAQSSHFGVRAMRAAAADVGGQVTIRPNGARGVAVCARFPISDRPRSPTTPIDSVDEARPQP